MVSDYLIYKFLNSYVYMKTETKCARSVKSIGLLGPDFDRNVAILFPS